MKEIVDMERRISEIRELLARYYEGETSLSDERRLRRLLAETAPLPADLEEERMLFAAIAEASEAEVKAPADLSGRIAEAIAAESRAEKARKRSRLWRFAAVACAAAASVAAIFITARDAERISVPAQSPRVQSVAEAVAPKDAKDTVISIACALPVEVRDRSGHRVSLNKSVASRAAGKALKDSLAVNTSPSADIEALARQTGLTVEEYSSLSARYHIADTEEAVEITDRLFGDVGNTVGQDVRVKYVLGEEPESCSEVIQL